MSLFHHKTGDADGGAETPVDKHKQTIIAIAGVAGVLIALITFRRISAAGSASSAMRPIPPSSGGSSTNEVNDWGQINQQLAKLGAQQAEDYASLSAQETTDVGKVTDIQSSNDFENKRMIDTLTEKLTGVSGQVNNLPNAQATPKGLDQGLLNQLAANGESVVKTVTNAAGNSFYLTSRGGVYAPDGGYVGSYLGYAATTNNPSAEIAGHGNFSGGLSNIDLIPGGYQLTNKQGETYKFGTGPGQLVTK